MAKTTSSTLRYKNPETGCRYVSEEAKDAIHKQLLRYVHATADELSKNTGLSRSQVEAALVALEAVEDTSAERMRVNARGPLPRLWCLPNEREKRPRRRVAAMRVAKVLALLALWVPTVGYAAPLIGPGTQIPGVAAEMAAQWIAAASALAKSVVGNHGEPYGYANGDRISDADVQCMLYFGLMGKVQEGLTTAKPGSFIANGLKKAEKWAQDGIDDKCKPRGGQMNAGLLMMMDASKAASSGNNRNRVADTPLLTPQQKDVLIQAAKWVAVGAAALLAVPNLALP